MATRCTFFYGLKDTPNIPAFRDIVRKITPVEGVVWVEKIESISLPDRCYNPYGVSITLVVSAEGRAVNGSVGSWLEHFETECRLSLGLVLDKRKRSKLEFSKAVE